jgi:hypothetical protein
VGQDVIVVLSDDDDDEQMPSKFLDKPETKPKKTAIGDVKLEMTSIKTEARLYSVQCYFYFLGGSC